MDSPQATRCPTACSRAAAADASQCPARPLGRAHRPGREEGAIAVVIPILAVGLMAVAGLVIDGGTALAARGRAADVAQQAARAGADALAPDSLRRSRPNRLAVGAQTARAAAQRVLAVGAVSGQVDVAGDTVTVHATVQRPTAILSAVGLKTVHGSASSTAVVLYGGTSEER